MLVLCQKGVEIEVQICKHTISTLKQRANAEENGVGHAKQRDDNLTY